LRRGFVSTGSPGRACRFAEGNAPTPWVCSTADYGKDTGLAMETSPERTPRNETEELQQMYDEIYDQGGFVKEFMWKENLFGATVGDMATLKDWLSIDEADAVSDQQMAELTPLLLWAYPGKGTTRADAIREARDLWRQGEEAAETGLMKYGSFEEKGCIVTAYMPASDSDRLRWTITVEKDGELIRTEYVGMNYQPIFGPDADDVGILNEHIEKLVKEL
jgi:hypothetical protein